MVKNAYLITWTGMSFNNSSNKYIRVTKDATHLGDSTTQGEIYRLIFPASLTKPTLIHHG